MIGIFFVKTSQNKKHFVRSAFLLTRQYICAIITLKTMKLRRHHEKDSVFDRFDIIALHLAFLQFRATERNPDFD